VVADHKGDLTRDTERVVLRIASAVAAVVVIGAIIGLPIVWAVWRTTDAAVIREQASDCLLLRYDAEMEDARAAVTVAAADLALRNTDTLLRFAEGPVDQSAIADAAAASERLGVAVERERTVTDAYLEAAAHARSDPAGFLDACTAPPIP